MKNTNTCIVFQTELHCRANVDAQVKHTYPNAHHCHKLIAML